MDAETFRWLSGMAGSDITFIITEVTKGHNTPHDVAEIKIGGKRDMTEASELKPIEAGGIDFSEFEGKKAKIASAEVLDVKSDYDENGKYVKGLQRDVQVLRVVTEPVTSVKDQDGNDKDIGASEIFNLKKDAEGHLGWSTSPKGKLNKFLRKMNVKAPKALIGKQATIRVRAKENQDGTTSEFLGFIID